ncbi:MAG: MFS transporter [Candidatus Rokubacteria bacterium]|nr:MFS transporter [Candidatus Rokubacteria bacterium]
MPSTRRGEVTQLSGLRGYLEAIRLFSRNARLYLAHIVGMDLILGTWEVLFNLYLLAVGFGIEFIGLRILIGGIASSIASLPAGVISDRIGRKWSFLIGDGGGAAVALVNITTTDRTVLLVTPVIGAVFGALHAVSESAFMAENSAPRERVHLFSVGSALSTGAATAGSLLAGLIPLWMTPALGKVAAYRWAASLGIVLWFLSLIPAWMLRQHPGDLAGEPAVPNQSRARAWILGLDQIHNPVLIAKLVTCGTVLSFGAGFVVPLFNVFFHEGLHAQEHQIGLTFASGSAFLALATLLAPFVHERLGKVPAIVLSRLASVPFILIIAFAQDIGPFLAPALSIAGVAYVLRVGLMNIAAPVASAFSMELLDQTERGTATGLQMMGSGIAGALASYLGSRMMAAGDYHTPFGVMAALYFISTGLFWIFFRREEKRLAAVATA